MGWYGLSDSEHEIMKYIWKHEEVTLREVVAWLENRGYTWKQQTVYTLLNRLIDKGLVGSVAYVAYKLLYLMTGKEKLSASGRWILLRLVMAFYLLPFPLLSEPLKRMIRDLSDKDILFRLSLIHI